MRRLVIIDQDGNSIKNDIFEKIFDIRESEIERKLEVRESFIKENNLSSLFKFSWYYLRTERLQFYVFYSKI